MNSHSRSHGHGDIVFDLSPDGKSIVYAAEGNGGRDLFQYNISTKSVIRLTNSAAYDVGPAYSPDGSMIAFTSGEPGVRADQLWTMNLTSRDKRRLTDLDENHASATFEPTGKRIYFTRESEYRWGGLASSWNEGGPLFSVDLEGKNLKRELPDNARLWAPQLSRDGRWIAWWDLDGGFYSSTLPGSRPIHLGKEARETALSPDGKWIAYSAGQYSPDHKIYLKPTAGGAARMVGKGGKGCFKPRFSPDGKSVYFLIEEWLQGYTGHQTVTLWKVNLDGSGKTLVMPRELFTNPE